MSINSLKNIHENFDEIKNDVYTIKLEGKEYIVIRKDSNSFKSLLKNDDGSDNKTLNLTDKNDEKNDENEDNIIKKLDEDNNNSRKMMWIIFGVGGLFLLIFIVLVFRYLFSGKSSQENINQPLIEPDVQETPPNLLNLPSPPPPPPKITSPPPPPPKPITHFEDSQPTKSLFSFFKKNEQEPSPKPVSLPSPDINKEYSPKFSSFDPKKDIDYTSNNISRKSLLSAMRNSNNSRTENKSLFDSLFKKDNDKTLSLNDDTIKSPTYDESEKMKGGKRKYTRKTPVKKTSVKKTSVKRTPVKNTSVKKNYNRKK